jgi:hypothetical protein
MMQKMGAKWAEEQRQRTLRLDRLYVLDGRHHSDHPQHGLYTGLAEKADALEREAELS